MGVQSTSAMSQRALYSLVIIVATVCFGHRPAGRGDEVTIALREGDHFTNVGRSAVAISPDGTQVVYAANDRLYLQALDGGAATPIAGTEGKGNVSPRQPFFSRDGQWVGFWQERQLKKVPIGGGAAVVICAAQNPRGVNWSSDGTILYGQSDGIWKVSGDGGTPLRVVSIGAGQTAHGPQLLPGGRAVLFTLARGEEWETAKIVVHSLVDDMRRVLLDDAADARYVAGGHLVYASKNTLWAVAFDVRGLAVTGPPIAIAEPVAQQPTGVAQYGISDTGTVVYLPADAVQDPPSRSLVWVDRSGRETALDAPQRLYLDPRLSPDGRRVALEIENDIWVLDIASATLARLTNDPSFESVPIWTPDGRAIVFTAGRSGRSTPDPLNLWLRAADGSGSSERLTTAPAARQVPYAFTPDGTQLVFREHPANPGSDAGDLMVMSLRGDRQSRPLLQTAFREMNAELSPDGRWVAYQSNESGRDEIYVRSFLKPDDGTWRLSTQGGMKPLWARDGRELFYESAGALIRVPVTTDGAAFKAGAPTRLFEGPYFYNILERMYDVSLDGRRFLMVKESASGESARLSPRLIVRQVDQLRPRRDAASALFRAIREADTASIANALDDGANVNAPNADGDAPLLAAAAYSTPECVKVLLEAGADSNARDKRGGTALMRSVWNIDIVRMLLDHGAAVDATSDLGISALMVAANRPGGSAVVKLLLAREADATTPSALGIPPLMFATDFGDLETVKALVAAGANVKTGRTNGATPLFWAANGPNDVLVWLLEHGADANAVRQDGTSALMAAAAAGATGNVRALLDHGAEVNAQGQRGTALMEAAGSDRAGPDTVSLLLQRGADPNATGQRCDACIHEPRAEDGSGTLTALMLARQRGESDIVRVLLAAGATR